MVERLTGAKDSAPSSSKRNGASKTNGATTAEPIEIAAGDRLTVDQLERYLWSAADILRGSIDSSDYKNYIFGLLFGRVPRAVEKEMAHSSA